MTQADYLPLREATFFILVCLADAPKHGYAILKEVEALSDGRIILSTGTLYGAIKRLLEQGWIERLDGNDTDGRDKKSYCLTDLGRRVLKAESNRLAHVAMLSQQVLSRGNG